MIDKYKTYNEFLNSLENLENEEARNQILEE